MKLQRFEVSETPHLIIECYSVLDITGGREGEVAIKSYGAEEDLAVERDGAEFTITTHSRCKVGCPQDTVLTLRAVHGDLRLRRVYGPITAETLSGDTALIDVGPTTVVSASGDVRIRSANGDVTLENVSGDVRIRGVNGFLQLGNASGDLSVRGIQGQLEADNVSGDFSARGVLGRVSCRSVSGDLSVAYLEGGLDASISGDASLKTDFTAGRDYRITASGDVTARFPASASARFQVTASGNIHHKVEWSDLGEDTGSTLTGRIGDGEANVEITSRGSVTLRSKEDAKEFIFGFEPEEAEFDVELESMAEELERSIQAHMAQMDRLNAQIEAELSRIDDTTIQRKVQEAARKAERAAERARLKAEKAQRRWERMGAQRPVRPASARRPTAPRPPSDPVSEEERLMILRMVQEGKISSDEAARLLEALEG
jgi:DUF4097 and DUF4098 domain-containing protein YvlB